MNRRTFVAVAGTASTWILVGCGNEGPGDEEDDESEPNAEDKDPDEPGEPDSNGDEDATPSSDGGEDATPDSNGDDAAPSPAESGATVEDENQESEDKN